MKDFNIPSARRDAVLHSMPVHDMQPIWGRLRVCQNTLLITKDRYIAEHSYEVAI